MNTQNKYTYIIYNRHLECETGCLLILVGSWMVLRTYPEKGRSIGQENTEMS